MGIQNILTFLVHPRRGSEDLAPIRGATVGLSGQMFLLLDAIYSRSENECDIDIVFKAAEDGSQNNECRNLIIEYLQSPTLTSGRRIAERLESVTDRRSGLGLLFLISGKEGRDHKMVISRFPTDSAILADEGERTLTVQYLERVFMKSKYSYKAVSYRDSSLRHGLWEGRAIDKQRGDHIDGLPNYWISEFLLSDIRLTAAAGTRRMGVALRDAARNATLAVKQQIAAAATLATGLKDQRISIREAEDRFGFSAETRAAIRRELKTPELAEEKFQFDLAEFESVIPYRSVELNNGGLLTAPSGSFDEVFERENLPGKTEIKFSTIGKIVSEKLTKTK